MIILNESDTDYRKLNFIRITMLKEQSSLVEVEERELLRYFKNVLRVEEESPVYQAVKDCCVHPQDPTKLSMFKLNLLIDLFYHYPYLKK